MKKLLALALVIVSVLAIALPALAAGYDNYLGPDGSRHNLRYFQKNERVANLQIMLIHAGYNPGAVDGIFGDLTDTAVRNFQRDYSLDDDGIVGADTKERLYMALDFQIPDPCTYVDPTVGSDDLPRYW